MGRTKRKEGFHVVLTTHNSRTSKRMIKHGVRKGEPRLLNLEEEIQLTCIIAGIIQENDFSCTAYNICQDHVHLILVCRREELSRIVGVIKGKSAYLFNRRPSNGFQPVALPGAERTGNEKTPVPSDGKGLKPLGAAVPQNTDSNGFQPVENKNRPLWSQKFFRADLDIWRLAKLDIRPGYLYLSSHLNNATHYIHTNRQKHNLPLSDELQSIISKFVITEEKAFANNSKKFMSATTNYQNTLAYTREQDAKDPLAHFRDRFHLPLKKDGTPHLYFCGNSLGLQPKSTRAAIEQELLDWEKLGVEGHFHARNPWMPYHEFLTEKMAEIVGAKPIEVVVMNTLTVNLHLMMVSFYRPTKTRYKILIEADAFPSDRYAVASQLHFHGFDPKDALIELKARAGEECLRQEDIEAAITENGASLALVMLGNTNYYTGQFFPMKKIAALTHAQGAMVGFDCAHGAGNVPLELHDSGADFAMWCSYKYLNSGPGSLSGCFVHERHAHDKSLPRFTGWWGHNKETRFGMRDGFDPIPGAEAWQLSNPPILSLAAVKASLEIFAEAGMDQLRKKSLLLTGYMEYLIDQIGNDQIKIITPREPKNRGCQLSIQVKNADKKLFNELTEAGVIADWREPDVIRVAPVPLYNSFEDVYHFVSLLSDFTEMD